MRIKEEKRGKREGERKGMREEEKEAQDVKRQKKEGRRKEQRTHVAKINPTLHFLTPHHTLVRSDKSADKHKRGSGTCFKNESGMRDGGTGNRGGGWGRGRRGGGAKRRTLMVGARRRGD